MIEPLITIDAPRFSSGTSDWIWKYAPFTLVSKTWSHSASSMSANGASFATPALTNTASSRAPAAAIALASSRAAATLPVSLRIASASPPSVRCAAASASASRPVMITRAPSDANACAAARPMPLVPPVTSTVLPVKRSMMFSSDSGE
ncbi:hypothetical protein WT42_07565 [Burkholderia stagnalis]|nr:hypothetical protein WT42_07565 [Burkholderia stagnalis]KWO09278.1 hypothetical protein WT93_03285 [Burkholderia stagnalis]